MILLMCSCTKVFSASGEVILGRQRYFIKALFTSTLSKHFTQALYTNALSNHFTQAPYQNTLFNHCIQALDTGTLTKHFAQALYPTCYECIKKVLQRYDKGIKQVLQR